MASSAAASAQNDTDSSHMVLVINGPGAQGVSEFECIPLLHPKYGVLARYLIVEGRLYEIQRVRINPSSWIIDSTIEKDGSLYQATPMDPLFVVLPMLVKSRKGNKSGTPGTACSSGSAHEGYFLSFADILTAASSGSGSPAHTVKLHTLTPKIEDQLVHLCDVKAGWDENVYRLNDAKVLAWLKKKALRLMAAIPSSSAPLGQTAAAADESKTAQQQQQQQQQSHTQYPASTQRTALGLLSEYIPSEFFDSLARAFDTTSQAVMTGRSASSSSSSSSSSSNTPAEMKSWAAPVSTQVSADMDTTAPPAFFKEPANKKAKAKSASAAKLAKIDTSGMQSLFSYFGKK